VEGNKNTLCSAFCPLSHLGYCWQHTAQLVHATIQTADVSLSIRPFHRGESFVRLRDERDGSLFWLDGGGTQTRRETNGERGEREKKNERDIQYEPQACCGTAAAPTNSLSNSNGQTKPVATLPGWDYYTRDLNNKYVRVSCATETCMAFKRVHECYFNSIPRAMPVLP